MDYPTLRRALNSENKGEESVTAATTAQSSADGSDLAGNGAGRGDRDTTSSGEKGTDDTTKDNPSDETAKDSPSNGTTKDNPNEDRGGPAPKKAWSKFTKDMIGNKTDFLDEMLRDFDVIDYGNGSLTLNGVLYTIPPEMYTNTTGEAAGLPDGNTTDVNYTADSVA
jgi:hypothetical protein